MYYFGLDLPNLVGVMDLEGGRDTIYADDYTINDIIWMGPQTSGGVEDGTGWSEGTFFTAVPWRADAGAERVAWRISTEAVAVCVKGFGESGSGAAFREGRGGDS